MTIPSMATSAVDEPSPTAPAGLGAAWREQARRASAPGAAHADYCRGGHGWLLDAGVDAVVEPLLQPGRVAAGDVRALPPLGAAPAAALLDRLPREYADASRHNHSPTLGTVLRAVVAHPDDVRAVGYLVGPDRCDERLTVSTVLVRVRVPLRCDGGWRTEVMRTATARLGIDDHLAPPDELEPWWGAEPPGEVFRMLRRIPEHEPRWYRLWWD